MKRMVGTVVLVACLLFLGASGASAALVNIRPLVPPPGPPAAGESSLATIFASSGFGSVDPATNQNPTAYWQPTIPPPSNSEFQLRFEFASSASGNSFGMYALGNTANKIELFPGALNAPSAGPNTYTSYASFDTVGNVIVHTYQDGVIPPINAFSTSFGTTKFGFYFTSTALGVTWYSEDALNSGDGAHMLAFVNSTNDWLFAWENQFLAVSDKDYNDLIVVAQSITPITPVPEPGTMMLLGSGLVGLAGWGRKKFRK